MDKLNKIISQLSDNTFIEIESDLIKNKSENFLLLFKSYRNHAIIKDTKLRNQLNCSENALYVLKSRLYDKIQKYLLRTDGVESEKNSVNEEVSFLTYLYDYPRETALAILHKIEEQYVNDGITSELIQLYSVFKKAYYHSDKYYYYSQLYNKQVAYAISIEKAEDVLCNFNKTLANYYFSRSDNDKEAILVLLQEVENIYSLNNSHRIELIKNFIIIQILLFTDLKLEEENTLESSFEKCDKIRNQFTHDKQMPYFEVVINYFKFEYYNKTGQFKKSLVYFDFVNKQSQTWLLQNKTCIAFKFLFSKINVFVKLNQNIEIKADLQKIYYDNNDFYTIVSLKFFSALSDFYNEKTDEGIIILSELIQEITLKDFPHLDIELKLTLAYFYYKQGTYIPIKELFKGVYRKINKTSYINAKSFILLLNSLMNSEINTNKSKINAIIRQYNLQNLGQNRILDFLQPQIDLLALSN